MSQKPYIISVTRLAIFCVAMALRSQLQIQTAQYGQTDAELAGGPASSGMS